MSGILVTSTVRELRTLTVGRREWIPSCSVNLQISLETDGNGVFSSGYCVNWLRSRGMVGSGSKCAWELGEAVPDRRETDKALYMSLAMACKNEALDVVKTVTHKRGFGS